MLLFISIAGYVIICVETTMICREFPGLEMSRLILAGMVELLFEIAGVIKIYKSKDKDE